jgi:hypothetical protein
LGNIDVAKRSHRFHLYLTDEAPREERRNMIDGNVENGKGKVAKKSQKHIRRNG